MAVPGHPTASLDQAGARIPKQRIAHLSGTVEGKRFRSLMVHQAPEIGSSRPGPRWTTARHHPHPYGPYLLEEHATRADLDLKHPRLGFVRVFHGHDELPAVACPQWPYRYVAAACRWGGSSVSLSGMGSEEDTATGASLALVEQPPNVLHRLGTVLALLRAEGQVAASGGARCTDPIEDAQSRSRSRVMSTISSRISHDESPTIRDRVLRPDTSKVACRMSALSLRITVAPSACFANGECTKNSTPIAGQAEFGNQLPRIGDEMSAFLQRQAFRFKPFLETRRLREHSDPLSFLQPMPGLGYATRPPHP